MKEYEKDFFIQYDNNFPFNMDDLAVIPYLYTQIKHDEERSHCWKRSCYTVFKVANRFFDMYWSFDPESENDDEFFSQPREVFPNVTYGGMDL